MRLGIDNIENYLSIFKDKKVGLITNPTGVNSNLVPTIDILHKHAELVSLFSPEHGVRGDIQAGVKVDDYIDKETGLKVYSLYGKNKKPSKEMLENIDILCFDIQGVGARFYTFLYTMSYALEACKEYGKEMVVFDRPNPVNGVSVEGNILDTTYRSFVGNYPLPQRYGLTIGELAVFFNREYNIHANLTVVKMEGYNRKLDYNELHLHWLMPSPNIPTIETTYHYLGTCLFEGTNMSEGRGTTKPFSIIGSPYFKADIVLNELKKYEILGVHFRKLFFTPTFSKHSGVLCEGIELLLTDKKLYEPVKTAHILLDIIKRNFAEFAFIKPFKEGHHPFIDLLNGDNYMRTSSLTLDQQLQKIKTDTETFKKSKRRYHLYE